MDVTPILRSNDPPNDSERSSIASYITAQLHDIDVLDLEIAQTEARLALLRSKRDRLSNDLRTHKAALSAIRHLPTELLLEIFVKCLENEPPEMPWRPSRAPMSLACVCSGWRKVVLQAPELWRTMIISCSALPVKAVKSIIQTWFSRAAPSQVSLICHTDDPGRGTRRKNQPMKLDLHPILDIVSPYSHRLESIATSLPLSILSSFSVMPRGSLDRLKSLDLYCTDDNDPLGVEYLQPFQSLPILETLILDPRSDTFRLFDMGVDWSNLIVLSVGWLTEVHDYLPLLAACTRLQECQIDIAFLREVPSLDQDGIQKEQSIITLPSLHTLTLSVCDFYESEYGHPADAFFSHVYLPSLRSFNITPDARGAYLSWPHNQFLSLCQRSGINNQLTRLDILIDDTLPNSKIQELIRRFGNLEHLALGALPGLDNESLGILARTDTLPRLQCLELVINGDAPSSEVFKRFLVSRIESGVLREVLVGHRRPGFKTTLRKWKADFLRGARIKVETHHRFS